MKMIDEEIHKIPVKFFPYWYYLHSLQLYMMSN